MSDLAREFYRNLGVAATGRVSRYEKRRNEHSKRQQTRPFEPGRDPISAADSISGVLSDFHWDGKLAEAGVPAGFILVKLNNKLVNSADDVAKILGELGPGDGVLLQGYRPNGRAEVFAFAL